MISISRTNLIKTIALEPKFPHESADWKAFLEFKYWIRYEDYIYMSTSLP